MKFDEFKEDMKSAFNKKAIIGLALIPVMVMGFHFAYDVSQALRENPEHLQGTTVPNAERLDPGKPSPN